MFPSNLHKNIIQLDRQISLLENECKNMEVDKRKKPFKPEHLNNKCSRASNLQINPPVKIMKKSSVENSKRTKKLAPSFSARVHSSSSLQSSGSKPWSEINETLANRKIKPRGMNTNPQVYTCQKVNTANFQNPKKINKYTNCICCSEGSLTDLSKKNIETDSSNIGEAAKDQILHKQVLFSNPGGRIEVTVTQKHNDDVKENSNLKKKNSFVKAPEKVGSCPCQFKGQKWSEILSLDPVKQKSGNNKRNSSNFALLDEIGITKPTYCCSLNKILNEEVSNRNQNKSLGKESPEMPVKLVQQPQKITKEASHKSNRPEKETQCHLEVNGSKESGTQFSQPDLIQFFQFLMKELEKKPSEEKIKLLKDMEYVIMKLSHNGPPASLFKKLIDDNKNDFLFEPLKLKSDFQNAVKQHCENLMKEKELLSKELSNKENTIVTMQKREEEYLSLISSLKLNLEKAKMNAQDGINALKELNLIKKKFLEQAKISEALKKSLSRMQNIMERCALENDKLKTHIQIFKLEAQKNDVLLAGKEAEIKRYKEEIQNFQRQISDHLASLKSNAQTTDVQKMMESIVQQSQIFVHKNLNSVIAEKEDNDSSRPNNGLMHSSPTSTKTSVVNSSWKRISSIRDNDQMAENADVFTEMNEIDEKEFIPIFGEDSSSESSKNSKETLKEKPLQKQEKNKFPSFASFASIGDDDDCGYSSTSKNEAPRQNGKPVFPPEEKSLMSKKVQKNIDELLENMKLQWSKEVRGTSPDNFTIDDFLNSSQISSISVASENVAFPDTPK